MSTGTLDCVGCGWYVASLLVSFIHDDRLSIMENRNSFLEGMLALPSSSSHCAGFVIETACQHQYVIWIREWLGWDSLTGQTFVEKERLVTIDRFKTVTLWQRS